MIPLFVFFLKCQTMVFVALTQDILGLAVKRATRLTAHVMSGQVLFETQSNIPTVLAQFHSTLLQSSLSASDLSGV